MGGPAVGWVPLRARVPLTGCGCGQELGAAHAAQVAALQQQQDRELARHHDVLRAVRAEANRVAAVREAEAQRRQAEAVLDATAGMVSLGELTRDTQAAGRLEAATAEAATLRSDRQVGVRKEGPACGQP